MRRIRNILLIFLALLGLASLAAWGLFKSDIFWSWGGRRLVELARERLPGDLQVGEITGTPFTGLTFRNVAFRQPGGEVFHAKEVQTRFSLISLVKREPVVANLTVVKPRLTLRFPQDKPTPPASSSPAPPPAAAPPFLQTLTFSQVQVQDGEVVVISPERTWRFSDVDLELALTVLRPWQPQQAWLLRRATLDAATPRGRLHLDTRLSYSQQRLAFPSLVLKLETLPVLILAGEAHLGEAEPTFTIDGEVGPLSSGDIRLWLTGWPDAWDLKGKVHLEGTPSQLHLSSSGQVQGAAFHLQGDLARRANSWQYEAALDLKEWPPALLAAVNQSWGRHLARLSPLSASLHLKGEGLSWPPQQFDYSLDCRPFTYGAARLEQLQLAFSGSGGREKLAATLLGNLGRVAVQADGPILVSRQGNLTLQAEGFQPALLGVAAAGPSLLNGRFAGSFRFKEFLSPGSLWLGGKLEAHGRLGQIPLKELRASLAWDKPKLEISQAACRLGDLAADLKGSLAGERINVSFQARLTPGSGWPVPASWQGQLTGDGTLTGTVTAPQVTFQARGQALAAAGLACQSTSLQATLMGWPPQAGTLKLEGSALKTPVGVFGHSRLTCEGQARQWRFHLQASTPEGPRAELQGIADLRGRPLALQLARCRLDLRNLSVHNAAPVLMRFSPGLEVEPATFKLNGGELQLQARLLGREVSGTLTARDLPAGLPATLAGLKGQVLTGTIQGQATLSGESHQPVIQGQVTLGPGRWKNYSFSSCATLFNYRDRLVTFTGRLEEKAVGPRLSWDGRIPLAISFLPFRWAWGDDDLRLGVHGENANLSLLSALTKEVSNAEGPLEIWAEWRGPVSQPRVNGLVRYGPGSITFGQAGLPYRLVPGEIRLQGDTISIPPLTLESGGTATLSGTMRLAGFLPEQMDVRAQLQDFKALGKGGTQAVGTGALTLSGSWPAPVVQGHLMVTPATFQTSFFQRGIHDDIVLARPPAPPPSDQDNHSDPAHDLNLARNLKMDITLETPGAWVKNRRARIELAGRLKARKLPGRPPTVGGDLRALQGSVEIHDHAFKVVQGTIHLPGQPGQDVTLKGQAIYEMPGVTLVMDASGPVKKPRVQLSSIPPLPPADVLAYLVFGRPALSLTREQFATIGQQAVGILGGVTAKTIQEFLGKDFPLVGNLSVTGGQDTVGVAKPLTRDLTISLERKTNPIYRDDLNQVRLEYRVNRHLSVESQVGRRNPGADVLLNLDF